MTSITTLYLVALPLSLGAMEILAPLLILCALIVGFLKRNHQKDTPFHWSLPLAFWPLVSLWLVALVGVFWNHLPQGNAIHAVGKLRWILIYFFLHNIFSNTRYWHPLPKRLLFLIPLLVLIALYAISQFWLGIDIIRGDDFHMPIAYHPTSELTRWRSVGFFNSPLTYGYSFAAITCLLSPLVIQNYLKTRNKGITTLLFLALLILCLSIGTTYSRGVWLGLLGGLSVVFFNFNRRFSLIFLSTLFLGLALYTPFNKELKTRITSVIDLKYTSNLERLKIWRANWELVKSSPLIGVGYEYNDVLIGDVYEKLDITDAPKSHAHSTYMQFLAGTGFLGLSLFLLFVTTLLKSTWKLTAKPEVRFLALGILGLHVSILIGGLTECNFKDAEINHLFIFFAAIISAMTAYFSKKNQA